MVTQKNRVTKILNVPAVIKKAGWHFNTLRIKMLAAFMAIALIPLSLILYSDYQTSTAALTESAYRSLFAAASHTANGIDAFISANLNVIETEAKLPALAEYLSLPVDERSDREITNRTLGILESFVKKDRIFIASYALLDMGGQNILDTRQANIGMVLSNQDYFQAALETGLPYVSAVKFSQDDGNGYLYFSSPVFNNAGKPVGVLRAQYSAAVLQQLIVRTSGMLGTDSFAVLLDENRLSIAQGNLFRPVYKTVANMPEFAKGLDKVDSSEPYFEIGLPAGGSEMKAGAVVRMNTIPWLVTFFQPREIFLEPIHAQIKRILYFALITAFTAAGIAFGISWLLSKPVVHLTAIAGKVAEGDLAIQADIASNDEIGIMAATFNNMINQLRKREEAIRESEEKYRSLVDNLKIGVYRNTSGSQGGFIQTNPAMAKIFGYDSMEEFMGVSVSDLYQNPEDRKTFIEEVRQNGFVKDRELALRKKDGTPIRCSCTATVQYDENGNIKWMDGVVEDITGRKLMEEALRQSEKKYRMLFNNANDVITIWRITDEDKPGEYLEVNDVACQKYGYTRDKLLTMTPLDLYSPEELERIPVLWQELRTRGMLTYEINRVAKDGKKIPFECCSHIFTLNNEQVGFCISRDITERKKAEKALRETNEKLNAIIRSAPLAILVLNPEGIIESWNYAAEKIFGRKAQEVIGCYNPIDSDLKRPEFREGINRVLAGETLRGVELQRRKKDGTNIVVKLFASPLYDGQGNVIGILTILDDITELKRVEKELLESRNKAEKAIRMASLGAISAGIAHEINQPLNALRIAADSILFWHENGEAYQSDIIMDNLKIITAQVDRVSGIIRNIRSFTNQDYETRLIPCDLNEAVKEALQIVGQQVAGNSIKLKMNLSDSLPLIMGRKSGLEAVIANLIINAVQAFEAVDKNNKEIYCVTWAEEKVILEISDNATGVKEDLKLKLFDPYFTTKSGEGMGLGLFIVQSIMMKYNGQISVRNNEKGGATFRLEFSIA